MKNGSVIFNFVINIVEVPLDEVDETSMNFGVDTESDIDSDTESTFSNISKLEPYCLSLLSQMLASKIHKNQKRNLQRILCKELAVKTGADVAIAEQWKSPKVSSVRIPEIILEVPEEY